MRISKRSRADSSAKAPPNGSTTATSISTARRPVRLMAGRPAGRTSAGAVMTHLGGLHQLVEIVPGFRDTERVGMNDDLAAGVRCLDAILDSSRIRWLRERDLRIQVRWNCTM